MDLLTAPRSELIKLIYTQDDRIRNLETALAQLKSQVDQLREQNLKEQRKSFKANEIKKAPSQKKLREKGHSRSLDTPTHRILHSLDNCPNCGGTLGKPTVSYTRQIIELPKVKVRVTEHVVFKRWCANCQTQVQPEVDLSSQVVGKQRIGIRLMATIAVLRDRCRIPFRIIQTYLKICYGLNLNSQKF